MSKIKYVFLMILFIISISTIVCGKYVIEYINVCANIDIDRNPPKIELINIQNTNVGYESYANKTHTITARIKIIEKNIKENHIEEDNLIVKIGNIQITPEKLIIKRIEQTSDEIIYDIILQGIEGDGVLSIVIPEGIVIDKSLNANEEKIINTNINIDNTVPTYEFNEILLEKGNVEGNIIINESIRDVEGWNLSENKKILKKEFSNNIEYDLTIYDFAQNTTKVQISITKATNIQLIFASHNSEIGWTFGHSNYDIAGKESILRNQLDLKTEALAFKVAGSLDEDFVRARAYVYNHWGEGSQARCMTTNMIYNYGQNPSETEWKSMSSNDLISIENEKYFQFGGGGINFAGATDINGKKPIPPQIAVQHPYGISAITLSLKDYSYYSIVYQILVAEKGWLEPAFDGKETTYQYDKPMTAIRVTLVPKTERQYIIEKWKKDVGTLNVK